jgi:cupin 2 domain-containing protein
MLFNFALNVFRPKLKTCTVNPNALYRIPYLIMANLFKDIPTKLNDELIDILFEGKGVKVERIVSMGHASLPGFWYDQDMSEFVILLKGGAGLLIEGQEQVIVMHPGDYFNIPAHKKHRVEWTNPDEQTVWLAMFYK